MLSKIKKICGYFLYIMYSNVIYGLALYFVFTWLAKHSLFYAYLGNLALIVLGLIWDEYTQKMLESNKFAMLLKSEKDVEKSYRSIQKIINSFVSFRAALYLFYIVILFFSQILNFYPTLVSEDISNFVHANDYSILYLVAFDEFVDKFITNRKRMAKISAHLEESMAENQDYQKQ